MDGSRFDELARTLASRGTRRGFLAGLVRLAGIAATRSTAAACPPD